MALPFFSTPFIFLIVIILSSKVPFTHTEPGPDGGDLSTDEELIGGNADALSLQKGGSIHGG